MRELGKLRQRLLAAIGVVVVVAPGCSSTTSGGNGAAVDSVGQDSTQADTGGDDSGGSADTVSDAATDAAADTASDAAVDVAVDAEPGDGSVDTTDASDVLADVTPPDGGSADVLGGTTCDFGQPQQQCFTAAQLAWAVDMKFGGGEAVDAGSGDADAGPTVDYPVPPDGCPAAERVFDGCCNAATAGPVMVGDTCCYAFCVGGCCGRPLVLAGAPVVARAAERAGWARAAGDATTDVAWPLDAVTRTALVAAWTEDAAMEHASIASFARFSLELLRFGAPADLCADAVRAAGDEVEHAEHCYGLASRLAGVTLGPDALPLGPSVPLAADVDAAVAAAIVEGCVGETLAATLAASAARSATVPAFREALEVIAADEARHAELAWRFVRWALQDADDARRARAARTFEQALASLPEVQLPAGVDAQA